MAASNVDVWPQPHHRLYESLQLQQSAAGGGGSARLAAELEKHGSWLALAQRFAPPSAESRRLVEESAHVAVRGGKLPIEMRLRPATRSLSRLLELDEVQTHVLIKRWLKDEGREAPPGEDLLADPAVIEAVSAAAAAAAPRSAPCALLLLTRHQLIAPFARAARAQPSALAAALVWRPHACVSPPPCSPVADAAGNLPKPSYRSWCRTTTRSGCTCSNPYSTSCWPVPARRRCRQSAPRVRARCWPTASRPTPRRRSLRA
jgi:hypothetical protein